MTQNVVTGITILAAETGASSRLCEYIGVPLCENQREMILKAGHIVFCPSRHESFVWFSLSHVASSVESYTFLRVFLSLLLFRHHSGCVEPS